MFYFIPAWYADDRPWYDRTQAWYRGSGFSQFDDTINQLKLFESSGQACELLIFSYVPQLRYVMHRYDILEVPYWSFFDTLQAVTNTTTEPISYLDLAWPIDVEFIFSPFLVMARQGGKDLARIEFGDDGQLIWVSMIENDRLTKRYIFDDRGFVSSVLYFKNGEEHYQEYLNRGGEWCLREYLLPDDNHVEVSEQLQNFFGKAVYFSMTELVEEGIQKRLSDIEHQENVLVIASHPQHNSLLLATKGEKKVILSYYQPRFAWPHPQQLADEVRKADLVVADTKALTEYLQSLSEQAVQHLPLYDTRLRLGKSQRRKEMEIYLVIDGVSTEDLLEQLSELLVVMDNDDAILLHLVTYQHDQGGREHQKAIVSDVLEALNRPDLFLDDDKKMTLFEFGDEEVVKSRLRWSYLDSELAIQQALEYARLIVDLGDYPDLYTQVAGISAGIPQVNAVVSEFVEHQKNGYILKERSELPKAVAYYLDGLTHWNEALVHAVKKMDDYTSGRLVQRVIHQLE